MSYPNVAWEHDRVTIFASSGLHYVLHQVATTSTGYMFVAPGVQVPQGALESAHAYFVRGGWSVVTRVNHMGTEIKIEADGKG